MEAYLNKFFDKYLDRETILYFWGIFISCILAGIFIIINRIFFHYTGAFYIPTIWLFISPFVLTFLIIALCTKDITPRLSFFTKAYTTYFFLFLGLSVMSTGVQYTPFPLIDKYLVIIDQWMGFHTQALLNWTYAHPRLQSIFVYCYSSLGLELVFLPLIVAALGDKSAIQNYFLAFVISYIFGMTIYYFIPTAGPTVIFKNPHFLPEQHDTFLKFFEIHHRILLTTTEGGMIAFPSFHVLWACFMAYLCRHHKWLFLPILVLNIGVIASTVFLGWHYLTDVIGGILLAIGSIYWAHKISRDYLSDSQSLSS